MPTQSPDTVTTIEDEALDKESVIEFLGEEEQPETLELEKPKTEGSKDTKETDKKETKGTKPEEGEEELSLEDELEAELEEPDTEEELDLVAAPSRREILTKYPQLFKEFPYIEKAIYREQKYAELLPTIRDAEAAVEKSKLLDQYETEIVSGSTESLLSTVRDNDKEAFLKVVDNYLPTLFKVDQSAYYHTIGNVIKHTALSMARDGKASGDEELQQAAAVMYNFIFGTTTFSNPTKLSQEEVSENDPSKKKAEEIAQKEKALLERQYTTARDTLGSKVDNIIKSTVDKAIDPNSSMPDKIRQAAVREALETLEAEFEKDHRFRGLFDKLWERAFENDFNAESMDRIKKAYLSKAKTHLPYIIKKVRSEYLRGSRRDTTDDKDRKGHLPVGKTRTSTSLTSGKPNGNSKPVVPKGMSTLDYLNSDD